MSQSRQLVAIMFTDIVGYTALMNSDEQKAFELLKTNRALQKPAIEEFNGRWIKELGDGVLASFITVSDAVHAAIRIQKECNAAKDFQLRIGIHLGEIIFENNDVFGDGVNIASRIQTIARPGCTYVSEAVYENISNKKDIQTVFIKEEFLKNVKQPVKIYEVMTAPSIEAPVNKISQKSFQKSIAVLPFVNMSNDKENDFFCDGLSEELLNVLSQTNKLKVAARTSSFSFRGKEADISQIGNKLNVNTVLEGSVRKSGNRIRITAQLINVEDGYHLWSERYDRTIADIFDIQEEIALSIFEALRIKLFESEKEAVLKRYTENIEAYQLYLQGRFHYNQWLGATSYFKAIEYYDAAIKKDPDYALAYAGKAACYLNLWFFSHLPPAQSLPHMEEATLRSLALDESIAETHVSLARMKFWYEWDFKNAEREFRRAIEINPNDAEAHEQFGMMLGLIERKEEALIQAGMALELDPFSLMINWGAGWTSWLADDLTNMYKYAEKLIELDYNFFGGHIILGAANWTSGNFENATKELQICNSQNESPFTLSLLACLYGQMGNIDEASKFIDKLEKLKQTQPIGNYYMAIAFAGKGDSGIAFTYFEKAVEQHEGIAVYFRQHIKTMIPHLRADLRSQALMKRIGLI